MDTHHSYLGAIILLRNPAAIPEVAAADPLISEGARVLFLCSFCAGGIVQKDLM